MLPAYAGRTMQAELDALTKGLEAPKRPVVAIVGGAKVSTKIDLLENLVAKVDALVIGGGMANTFLHATGLGIGKSLAEKDLAATALRIIEKARESNCAIILPVDGVCAYEFKAGAHNHTYGIDAIPEDQMILDVGSQSVERINVGHQRCGDAGLERPARRLRDRRPSTRARWRRPAMRRSAPRPASSSRSPAAATRWRRSTMLALRTASPMYRPQAAPSSNGSRASPCPASRR